MRFFVLMNPALSIKRYPPTTDKSLRPWSAADEFLLQQLDEVEMDQKSIALYNDRFGFLTCQLHGFLPQVVINYRSQEKSVRQNLEKNQLSVEKVSFVHPLESPNSIDIGLIKVPKSLELFRLQLQQLAKASNEKTVVYCGFMTRHFSKQLLSIANMYFEQVEQSRAWKKARVLKLSKKKVFDEKELVNVLPFKEFQFKQYFGVFSSGNIDYASQFFIEHLNVPAGEIKVLDLASGNGVLAHAVQQKNKEAEVHLVDDSVLAVESSKMNLSSKAIFYVEDTLEHFSDETFDLVVSNPPFHFDYETNIEITVGLFQQVRRCIKTDGEFLLVANSHLNYKTHLQRIFGRVEQIDKNSKFTVYSCKP